MKLRSVLGWALQMQSLRWQMTYRGTTGARSASQRLPYCEDRRLDLRTPASVGRRPPVVCNSLGNSALISWGQGFREGNSCKLLTDNTPSCCGMGKGLCWAPTVFSACAIVPRVNQKEDVVSLYISGNWNLKQPFQLWVSKWAAYKEFTEDCYIRK